MADEVPCPHAVDRRCTNPRADQRKHAHRHTCKWTDDQARVVYQPQPLYVPQQDETLREQANAIETDSGTA